MKKTFTFLCFILFTSVIYGQSPKSQRFILAEEFTQASCGYCAQYNPAFNTLLSANSSKIIGLKYQVSWPGTDVMNSQNTADPAARVTYYGVTGAPDAKMDGNVQTSLSAITQAAITAEYAVSSPFTIALSHTYTSGYDSLNIICNLVATTAASYTGPLKLHVVLIETEIDFCSAPGTNGETVFYGVVRDMFPTASGTTLATSWTLNQADPHTFKVKIPTYIYDKERIAIVAFIQDDSNKNVKQTAYSSPLLLPLDAGFGCTALNIPALSCASTIAPVVTLKNYGSTTLTSATIKYKADAASSYLNYTWNGSLASGTSTNVTLPSSAITAGPHTYSISVTSPNTTGTDYNTKNDISTKSYTIGVSSGATVPPVVEGFTLTTFPPTGWMNVDVTADGVLWTRSTTVGGFGLSTNSAKIDFYNIASGSMDELFVKPIDLNTATSASLTFSVAYAQYSTSYVDTIKVMVSTNCGSTWTSAYTKYGSTLATAAVCTTAFSPTSTQWRAETVSLTPYIGHSVVYVKFHAGSNYGNDAYLDDINITVITSAENIIAEKNIEIFPNPSNGIVNITNLENANVVIYNLIGSKMLELNNANGNKQLDLSKFENGSYLVKVMSDKKVITQKLILNK